MTQGSRKVSLVKGPDRYANIKKSLELIYPDLAGIRGKKNILIKPNLTATKNPYANSDARSVQALLEFLLAAFPELEKSRFTVMEGSGSAYYEKTSTRQVYADFGYFELEKKFKNLRLECLEDFEEYADFQISSIAGSEKARLVKRFFDFDFRISIAIPKTHNYAIATFGIKNMAGMIKQCDKSLLHGLRTPSAPEAKTIFTYIPTSVISWLRRRVPALVNFAFRNSVTYLKATKVIHQNVLALAGLTWPDLVVLDAFYAMDGNGPVDGFPVNLKAAVSSADPLKADGVGARLMGLEPQDIGYLYYLARQGKGDYSLEGLVGEKIENVRQNFRMHPTYHIQKQWGIG